MKVLFLFFTCLFTSCGVNRQKCQELYPPQIIKETITDVREVLRDSIIRVPADSSLVKALLECDSVGNVYMKQVLDYEKGEKLNLPEVLLESNIITVTATVDSLDIYIAWKEKYETTNTTETVQPMEIYTNVLTGWQWFQIWCGRILILFIALVALVKLLTRAGRLME
ncbi:MAG: hypothetical protein LIO93_08440 [Bacteroidales bacterium]|nr:hypothetical protein [Bacteroidales bacterium]